MGERSKEKLNSVGSDNGEPSVIRSLTLSSKGVSTVFSSWSFALLRKSLPY